MLSCNKKQIKGSCKKRKGGWESNAKQNPVLQSGITVCFSVNQGIIIGPEKHKMLCHKFRTLAFCIGSCCNSIWKLVLKFKRFLRNNLKCVRNRDYCVP